MITVRKSTQRGLTQIDWLKSYHTFSFGEYYDPHYMGFGNLRVINEDRVQPAKGFGTHSHHDMEIISYVIDGALDHKDSMGTGSTIKPGEIQKMSAGSGVKHSEFNHSDNEIVHFLQIWILPNKTGIPPSYEQKSIPEKANELILIGSPQAGSNIVTIHQDVELYVAYLTKNSTVRHVFKRNSGWVQLIKGKIILNGNSLSPGDGAAINNETSVEIKSEENAEFLFFDLKQ
ncbi:MAG: pirin family protein [Gammaproteobacteria bacterium]|jgi:redox-sensitive bicupin YhaK (pirin superfamily)|nr:pirin family protein [Gammaproteobacteria bacterium]